MTTILFCCIENAIITIDIIMKHKLTFTSTAHLHIMSFTVYFLL